MTDAEVMGFLGLTPAEAVIVLPKITPEQRAAISRMRKAEADISLWMAGVGPKPPGVLVDGPRRRRRR